MRPPQTLHARPLIKPTLPIAATLALALAISANVHGLDVVRNAGSSTPNLADFSHSYANKAPGVGYGNRQVHRTFLETLPARCGAPDQRVASASFFLTVRKLSTTAADAQHTQLKFWDRGVEHFSTEVWKQHEPVGTVKTVTYNIANLPPINNFVRFNDGWGMALLADRDFSFSVNDDAGVIAARLHYQCSHRGGAHHATQGYPPNAYAPSPSYAAMPPAPAYAPSHIANPIRFSSSYGIGPGMQTRVPCPGHNVTYGRAAIGYVPFVAQIQRYADTQCTNRSAPRGFYSVRIASCNPTSSGGYSAPIEVTCAR